MEIRLALRSVGVIAAAAAAALTCTATAFGQGVAFTDVSQDAWYAKSVAAAQEQGLVEGYGDGRFGPEDTVTRAQAATMLWRRYGRQGQGGGANETGMPDVEDGAWYTAAANWAVGAGIFAGKDTGDGRIFDPEGPITREEMCAIMRNTSKSMAGPSLHVHLSKEGGHFTDAYKVSNWAEACVAWAIETKVIVGKDTVRTEYGEDGTRTYTTARAIDPQGALTRAEAATILVNAGREGLLDAADGAGVSVTVAVDSGGYDIEEPSYERVGWQVCSYCGMSFEGHPEDIARHAGAFAGDGTGHAEAGTHSEYRWVLRGTLTGHAEAAMTRLSLTPGSVWVAAPRTWDETYPGKGIMSIRVCNTCRQDITDCQEEHDRRAAEAMDWEDLTMGWHDETVTCDFGIAYIHHYDNGHWEAGIRCPECGKAD